MSDLDALEAVFPTTEASRATHAAPTAIDASVTSGYNRRLQSLIKAENGRYNRCLEGARLPE